MSIKKDFLHWNNRKVFFIYEVIAKQVKVTALDEASGIEVSLFSHSNTPKKHLNNVAMTKLALEIRKKQEQQTKSHKSPYGRQVWNSGWDDK